jgi:hypothetical protein
MLNHTHAGVRCYTRHFLRTVQGNLPRGSYGTVVHETENLGRQLVLINWDCGIAVPAFPHEIEFDDDQVALAH